MRFAAMIVLISCASVAVWSVGQGESDAETPAVPSAEETTEQTQPTAPDLSESADYPRATERNRLVDRTIYRRGITDSEVLRSMRTVPRHEFVPPEYERAAYADSALPIGHGQTISQPYIVAFMTDILNVDSRSRVLEIGTGSGYQAAVLSLIVRSVDTIEIIEPLAHSAAERLARLGYGNVTVHTGDGYFGWEAEAPYDAIIVTAAAGHIPAPLLEQLVPGGRMIIPVGPIHTVQQLILVQKAHDGTITTRQMLPVRFVPMTGRVQQ
jgi:protein-L-isoaspartate(D-aspartate) O-methyltransferase